MKLMTTHDASLFVPCGKRFDMINTITDKMKAELPKQKSFCLVVGKGDKQNINNTAGFAVQVPLPKPKKHMIQVPVVLSFSGCKAKASEKIRQRCTERLCVHLSDKERAKVQEQMKEEKEEKGAAVNEEKEAEENEAEVKEEIDKDDAVVEQDDDFSEDRG